MITHNGYSTTQIWSCFLVSDKRNKLLKQKGFCHEEKMLFWQRSVLINHCNKRSVLINYCNKMYIVYSSWWGKYSKHTLFSFHCISLPVARGEVRRLKRGFYDECHLPNRVRAVDGALITITAPTDDEEVYVCRKDFHALNCQAVVTTELKYVCFQPLHPSNSTELIHWPL